MPLIDDLKIYIQQPDSYIKMTLIEKYNLIDIIFTEDPYVSVIIITEKRIVFYKNTLNPLKCLRAGYITLFQLISFDNKKSLIIFLITM